MNDEFPPLPDDPSIIQAYAQAHAALELLSDRLSRSPVRAPWSTRMTFAQRHALAWIDNVGLSADGLRVDSLGRVSSTAFDVTHCKAAIGAPITLSALARDAEQLLSWLGYCDRPGQAVVPPIRARDEIHGAVEQWMAAGASLPPSPPLLHGCRMALLWRQHSPLGQGDLVASLLIGERWGPGRWNGSVGGLIALGLKATGAPWKAATGQRLERYWLCAIAAGARAHLDLESRLLGFATRARFVLERRKRAQSLKALLLFAMARPAITSAQVARQLEITSAGAIKLLSTATGLGLLIERTGQSSFRSYMVPVSSEGPSPAKAHSTPQQLFEPAFWSDMA